jgi:tRNA (guanine6-N2)-methyltransferase
MEKFRKHLNGAIRNAENAGVADTIGFKQGDATEMTGEYDVIITNPPYGLRIHRKGAIERLYRNFARAAKSCMNKNSRLAVITAEHELFKKAAEEAGLQCTHGRFVRYGGLLTKIMVFMI